MKVKGNHPLAEAMAKKLFGIDGVPKGEMRKMIQRAINIVDDKHTQLEQDYAIMESACNYWQNQNAKAHSEISRLRGIIEGLTELVDGCSEIIEIYKAESPAQIRWKREWLEKAKQQIKQGGV